MIDLAKCSLLLGRQLGHVEIVAGGGVGRVVPLIHVDDFLEVTVLGGEVLNILLQSFQFDNQVIAK